jgi:hypothetical protein
VAPPYALVMHAMRFMPAAVAYPNAGIVMPV